MKRLSIALIAVAAVSIFSFSTGVRRGRHLAASEDLQSEVINNLHLLRVAEAGDCAKLTNDIGILLLASTEELRKVGAGTLDAEKQRRLKEAFQIADRVKTNLVRMNP